MSDRLILMPFKKWGEIKSILKLDFPRSIYGYSFVDNMEEIEKKGLGFGAKVYCPMGDARNGIVALNLKRNLYEVIIQCPRDNTCELEEALRTTKVIDWTQQVKVPFAPEHVMSCVKRIIKEKNLKINQLIPAVTLLRDKNSPLFDVKLSQGYSFHYLSLKDLQKINENWPHKYPGSEWYFELLINANFGYGLFKDNELLAYVFMKEGGDCGILYTFKEHRNKGYGSLLTKLIVFLTVSRSGAQKNNIRGPFDHGHGFEVRLAVPGNPGNDYPTHHNIPKTSFSCSGKEPGYYADTETNCQVFRVCTFGSTYGFQSFLCPNGTLFNQAVFVCDWWMNVKCEKSTELYKYKNELGSFNIGPHFMRDIKKMITHPMRNPYDKTFVKNNLIIMQEYKPPNGQLYHSISENYSQRNFNRINSQPTETPKTLYQNVYNTNNKSFAATTPKTQYYSNFNIYPPINNNVDFFQQFRQRSYSQPNIVNKPREIQTDYFNGHTRQISPTTTKKNILSYPKGLQLRPTQIYQRSLQNEPYINSLNPQVNNQRKQMVNKKPLTKPEQLKLGAQHSKQLLNKHISQEKELYASKSSQIRYSKDISNQIESKTKHNLVSNDTSPTLIRKTLAFHKVIKDSKNGNPKSRITFKTWIVRPKSGKLLADPTPYIYNMPTNYAKENILPNNLSYKEDKASLIQFNSSYEPYEYNPPTISSNQIITSTTESPYTFVTSFSSSSPTKASLLYLPPTTNKPIPIIYGPPTDNVELSRQYLLPGEINSPLTAAGSSPVPFYQTPLTANSKEHSFSSNKQSLTNTNHNNLAFSDILTKEKLDITVSDIVRDTNTVLETASPNDIIDFREDIQTIEYPEDSYLPQKKDNESGEIVSLQPPPILPTNSRFIATPSIELEAPVESLEYSNENTNTLSNLPFIKKPFLPTIERTVSFKITIPEEIADYIFKKSSKNISNNLEILNTGNTNHFVLANKNTSEKESQYFPIGNIIWNNSSHISPSQDLVFSFLADSINAAKEYSNIATQNIALPASTQLRNLNSVDIEPISNKISQLTSAQYANKKSSGTNTSTKNDGTKSQPLQETRQGIKTDQPSTYKQLSTPATYLKTNTNQIYSGQLYQLPVPEVTEQFYNSPKRANAKFRFSNNKLGKNIDNEKYQYEKKNKQTSSKFDLIKSQKLSSESYQPPSNPYQEPIELGSTTNNFLINNHLPKDGITAQIHDNTIGTIPHPLNEDKIIKYKKNHIYYIYTHLNNNNITNGNQNNDVIINSKLSQPYRKQSNDVSYQLIPSIGYKLEDNIEKQKLLNTIQKGIFNTHSNQRVDIGADVDYIVHHPASGNGLYNGPSSYYAPQASIGNLELKQNTQKNFNANLEKFDTNESNGYPKIIPSKPFLF